MASIDVLMMIQLSIGGNLRSLLWEAPSDVEVVAKAVYYKIDIIDGPILIKLRQYNNKKFDHVPLSEAERDVLESSKVADYSSWRCDSQDEAELKMVKQTFNVVRQCTYWFA